MAIELLCRKIGMTRLFSDSGECIPVTVLEAGPNTIVQKKTQEKGNVRVIEELAAYMAELKEKAKRQTEPIRQLVERELSDIQGYIDSLSSL